MSLLDLARQMAEEMDKRRVWEKGILAAGLDPFMRKLDDYGILFHRAWKQIFSLRVGNRPHPSPHLWWLGRYL